MAYDVYRYAYDASTSSIAQDAVFAISGAPDDVDPMRWALLADSENCLYVFNTSNAIYSFQFNQDSNSYVYNDAIKAITITNAPRDVSFDSATIYYNGLNKVLVLKSIQFFDVLYQFGFDQDNMTFSYGKDVSGIVKLTGAPTDLNWSRFGVARTSNGSSLYAFQVGCNNIYQANFDSSISTYKFITSSSPIKIVFPSESTIMMQFSVTMMNDGYCYFVYNSDVFNYINTYDQLDASILSGAQSVTTPYDGISWMSGLSDDIYLNEVNLPGTHDSASIGTRINPYVCQSATLTSQLNGGVRFFDIRIKVIEADVKYIDENNNCLTFYSEYQFFTCHGNIGLFINANKFQSLESAFNEFTDFLACNPTESIVVSLKIEDYSTITGDNRSNVRDSLSNFLSIYKDRINNNIRIPKLSEVRGKIYLLNRIYLDNRFGAYININDNTNWQIQSPINGYINFYSFFQDHYNYEFFDAKAVSNKKKVITDAFSKYAGIYTDNNYSQSQKIIITNPILLNFISGNIFHIFKMVMNRDIILYLGSFDGPSRPKKLGWCPMDFSLVAYRVINNTYDSISLVQLIIDSNFEYKKYSSSFSV